MKGHCLTQIGFLKDYWFDWQHYHPQQSELSNAETAFRKALSQDPQDRGSRQLLGITLYREGRPTDAIPVLETEHASRRVTNEDPSYLLSLCYIDVERYDDARRTIAAGYGFPPNSPAAYLLISRILVRRGFMVPAEASARKALELNPRVPLKKVEMAPPDVSSALVAHAIKPKIAGFGRVLFQAREHWPDHISCILAVRQDLIDNRRGSSAGGRDGPLRPLA